MAFPLGGGRSIHLSYRDIGRNYISQADRLHFETNQLAVERKLYKEKSRDEINHHGFLKEIKLSDFIFCSST